MRLRLRPHHRRSFTASLLAALLLAPPLQAAPPEPLTTTFLGALKKSGMITPDQLEAVRYYIYNPDHAKVVYSYVEKEDLVFIAILVAAKAARGKTFTEDMCLKPVTVVNTVFLKSGESIDKYGQNDTIKQYLNGENQQAKDAADAKLAQYIPYWKDIPHICNFTFHSNFPKETEVKNNIKGVAKQLANAYDDFADGRVGDGVADLMNTPVGAGVACSIADDLVGGGMVGKVPVLGNIAKSACAGFAGKVIKGIASGAGEVVEFFHEGLCTAGIGTCTGHKKVDGFFDPNFAMFVWNYAMFPAQADAWTASWYTKVQKDRCLNQTGDEGKHCDAAWASLNTNARGIALKLRKEPQRIYDDMLRAKVYDVIRDPSPLAEAGLQAKCVESLAPAYPWPGPQMIDKTQDVVAAMCRQAFTRPEITGTGRSFEEQVKLGKAGVAEIEQKLPGWGKEFFQKWHPPCEDATCESEVVALRDKAVAQGHVLEKTNPIDGWAFVTTALAPYATQASEAVERSKQRSTAKNKSITAQAAPAWAQLLVGAWIPKCLDDPCRKEITTLGDQMVVGAKFMQTMAPNESALSIQKSITPGYEAKFKNAVDQSKYRAIAADPNAKAADRLPAMGCMTVLGNGHWICATMPGQNACVDYVKKGQASLCLHKGDTLRYGTEAALTQDLKNQGCDKSPKAFVFTCKTSEGKELCEGYGAGGIRIACNLSREPAR